MGQTARTGERDETRLRETRPWPSLRVRRIGPDYQAVHASKRRVKVTTERCVFMQNKSPRIRTG